MSCDELIILDSSSRHWMLSTSLSDNCVSLLSPAMCSLHPPQELLLQYMSFEHGIPHLVFFWYNFNFLLFMKLD